MLVIFTGFLNIGVILTSFIQNISLKKRKQPGTRKFSHNCSDKIHMFYCSYVFQAFGQGPRACIGMRFALLEAKIATMAVMRKLSFTPGTKTKLPLQLDANSNLAFPIGGLWAKVKDI